MKAQLKALTLVVLVTAGSLLAAAPFHLKDNVVTPVVVAPSPSTLAPGDSSIVTVGMSGSATSDTVVSITSSDPSTLSVPSTAVVHSGGNHTSFEASASALRFRAGAHSKTVTITVTANGGVAYNTITVN